MRVVVAAERPQIQNLLIDVVEEESGALVVGQAENATRALILVRKLRPDITIIDCNLPYSVGLDTVALSRISGLDIAQTISEKIPETRVIVVINLDTQDLLEHGLSMDAIASFFREKTGANIPFTLNELFHEVMPPNAPIFANVEVKPRATPKQKASNITEKAIFFGGLSIFVGWLFTITMVLAPVGVFLALAGVATVFLGLVGKLTALLRRKAFSVRSLGKEG